MITINESFVCIHCHRHVPKAVSTCRNHCPYCFVSRHVDGDIPGDRKTDCHGLMIPRGYTIVHQLIKIDFECISCGKHHINKAAADDELLHIDEWIQHYRSMSPLELSMIKYSLLKK